MVLPVRTSAVAPRGACRRGRDPQCAARQCARPAAGNRGVRVRAGLPVGGDDPEVARAGYDEYSPAGAGGRTERQRLRVGELDVAEQGESGRLGTGEVDAILFTDGAAAAVTTDQVRGPDAILTVAAGDNGRDRLGILLQGEQFVSPPDVSSPAEGVLLKDFLDPGLRMPSEYGWSVRVPAGVSVTGRPENAAWGTCQPSPTSL